MVPLQSDFDHRTQSHVLTCFMFPQQTVTDEGTFSSFKRSAERGTKERKGCFSPFRFTARLSSLADFFCAVSPVIHPFSPLRSLHCSLRIFLIFCGFSVHFFWPTWFLLILSNFFLSSVIVRSIKQWRFWQCPGVSAGRTNQAKIFNRLQHRRRWLFSKRHLCQKNFLVIFNLVSNQRRLDSSLQRFTGAISTNHNWGKPSCCRPCHTVFWSWISCRGL